MVQNGPQIIPYMDTRFLAITQPFFDQSSWTFLWDLKRLRIIYRLVMIILILMLFWTKLYFWPENGASRPDREVDPTGWTFELSVISKSVFKNLGPEPPPPLLLTQQVLIHFQRKMQKRLIFIIYIIYIIMHIAHVAPIFSSPMNLFSAKIVIDLLSHFSRHSLT